MTNPNRNQVQLERDFGLDPSIAGEVSSIGHASGDPHPHPDPQPRDDRASSPTGQRPSVVDCIKDHVTMGRMLQVHTPRPVPQHLRGPWLPFGNPSTPSTPKIRQYPQRLP